MKTEVKQINEGPERIIRDALIERKRKNPSYSLRSFARDLGMSPALLSLVLNKLRPLTLKQAHKLSALLELTPSEKKNFINLTLRALPQDARVSLKMKAALEGQDQAFLVKNVDIEQFHCMSNWYHFAILDLTTTASFKSDVNFIAKRVGISKIEAEAAIERLIGLGLLEEKNGKLKKTSQHFKWTASEPKAATRAFHQQMIEKAKAQLDQTDLESYSKRAIRGSSLAIDPLKIDEAKAFLIEFEKEFCRRFTRGAAEEVYQLNLQFFPLTQKPNPKPVSKGQV